MLSSIAIIIFGMPIFFLGNKTLEVIMFSISFVTGK
jgi:hypothetical protein